MQEPEKMTMFVRYHTNVACVYEQESHIYVICICISQGFCLLQHSFGTARVGRMAGAHMSRFAEFCNKLGPEFDPDFIKRCVGTNDFDEFLELTWEPSDLSPLVSAGMKPLHRNKLFAAIQREKGLASCRVERPEDQHVAGPSSAQAAAERIAIAATARKYRIMIQDVYRRHAPQMLDKVDELLGRYNGAEKELFEAVAAKYCRPAPAAQPLPADDARAVQPQPPARVRAVAGEAPSTVRILLASDPGSTLGPTRRVCVFGMHKSGTHVLAQYIRDLFDVQVQPRIGKFDGVVLVDDGMSPVWKHTLPTRPALGAAPEDIVVIVTVRNLVSWLASVSRHAYEIHRADKKRRRGLWWLLEPVEVRDVLGFSDIRMKFSSAVYLWAAYAQCYLQGHLAPAGNMARVVIVRHEDLITQPAAVVSALTESGLPRNNRSFQTIETSASDSGLARKEIRRREASQHLGAQVDEEWRRQVAMKVSPTIAGLMSALGYDGEHDAGDEDRIAGARVAAEDQHGTLDRRVVGNIELEAQGRLELTRHQPQPP